SLTNRFCMVSVASCNEMEVVSGELEERAEDFSEDHMLNEAFSGPGLEITPGEDAQDTLVNNKQINLPLPILPADDRLLRKKVLEPGPPEAPSPAWGQEVTLKMQGVLEDRMVVEKDCKLEFVIGEGDVNQALEECAISMRKDEIALLLADSQYTYGLLGREPDIPAWAPLLYQLQLVDFRDKPDPLDLPIPDRIRIGNQKRERGNFYFQREEYSMATRSYCMALDVLTTSTRDGRGSAAEEEEEVNDYRVKCLNNLAAAQLKLERYDEALHTCRDVLFLDPNNVKALFRTGKLLSDKGEYEEAMETLKKALKLESGQKFFCLNKGTKQIDIVRVLIKNGLLNTYFGSEYEKMADFQYKGILANRTLRWRH
uniref:peptidylprolyl isomerase n=1 Tax=Denticeps clupeoides TaxID=299321 RepID=A0AAY4BQH4_9TELE